MSKLLIDEHPLLVLPSLAAAIGLPESIFLQQLHYWLETSGHIQDDGRKWYFNTYENWSQQFPWWNIGTVRRLVNNLRAAGLILTTNRFNRMAIDNTLWYAIDYARLDQLTTTPPDTDPPIPPPDDPPPPSAPPDTDPPIPPPDSDLPIPADPPTPPSAETNRPRAQNAQTTRAKCTDHARILRAPITRDLLSLTSPKTSLVVVGIHTHSKPHRISSKKRAHARTRDPLPTYDAANRHPAAIDAALAAAGILDPNTRTGILNANPALTVAYVFSWDAARHQNNAGLPAARQMGHGALAAILRTGARPPGPFVDAENWLIANHFLIDAANPAPSDLPIPADPPTPDAADLWRRIVASVLASNPRFTIINSLHPVALTASHLTLTAPPDIAAYINTRRLSYDLLTLTAKSVAGRPITLDIQPAP